MIAPAIGRDRLPPSPAAETQHPVSDAPYSDQQLQLAKIVLIITWVFAAGSFFFPLYDWATGPAARALFWILLVAHAAEFAVFARLYRATGSSMASHFLNNLVFGVIHYTQVKQRHERA